VNPLAAKRILITRASGQGETVAKLLVQRGATALHLPCLEVQCLAGRVRKGLKGLPEDAAILLSSVNGVSCTVQAMGADFAPLLHRHPVIAVGEHTAAALVKQGIRPAWTAAETSQEGLIAGFAEHGLPGSVCFLRAEEGRDVLQQALQAQGTPVRLIHAYRTTCPDDDASEIMQALQCDEIDAVLLGSSRTAAHYVQRIGNAQLANRPAVAVISPQVAAAARHAGLSVQAVAKEASFAAMLDALADYFAGNGLPAGEPADTRSTAEEDRP